MISCPTCGRPVAENQRFCSNCGTDVQAALSYRASAQNASPTQPAPAPMPARTSGGFAYDTGAYDYAAPRQALPPLTIALIVGGVAILCLCCGIALGATGMYFFGPVPTPPASVPTPTPTPEGLRIWLQLFSL